MWFNLVAGVIFVVLGAKAISHALDGIDASGPCSSGVDSLPPKEEVKSLASELQKECETLEEQIRNEVQTHE